MGRDNRGWGERIGSWIGRLKIIINWSILPRLTYRFNAIPVKISERLLFLDIDKCILNHVWEGTSPRVAKAI